MISLSSLPKPFDTKSLLFSSRESRLTRKVDSLPTWNRTVVQLVLLLQQMRFEELDRVLPLPKELSKVVYYFIPIKECFRRELREYLVARMQRLINFSWMLHRESDSSWHASGWKGLWKELFTYWADDDRHHEYDFDQVEEILDDTRHFMRNTLYAPCPWDMI